MESGSEEFENFLESLNEKFEIKEFPESTKTSAEAAKVIGCGLSQIAKSIIFIGDSTGNPYLAIVSGPNKADESKIEKETGEKIRKADANFVKEQTGFSIGGVPPKVPGKDIKTFIDQTLMNKNILWAAAGAGNRVFSLTPEQLAKMTRGKVLDLS